MGNVRGGCVLIADRVAQGEGISVQASALRSSSGPLNIPPWPAASWVPRRPLSVSPFSQP